MTTSPTPSIEPWLRGTYADVPAVGRAVLHALDLASIDDISSNGLKGLTDAGSSRPTSRPAFRSAFHLKPHRALRSIVHPHLRRRRPAHRRTTSAALKAEQKFPRQRRDRRIARHASRQQAEALRLPMPPTVSVPSPEPTSTSFAALAASSCPPPSGER